MERRERSDLLVELNRIKRKVLRCARAIRKRGEKRRGEESSLFSSALRSARRRRSVARDVVAHYSRPICGGRLNVPKFERGRSRCCLGDHAGIGDPPIAIERTSRRVVARSSREIATQVKETSNKSCVMKGRPLSIIEARKKKKKRESARSTCHFTVVCNY